MAGRFFFVESTATWWKELNILLVPDDTDENSKRNRTAEMAEVSKLTPLNDALMIKKLANTFSLDPDVVYNKPADWVKVWLYADKMEREYQDRYQAADNLLNKKPET